MCVSRLTAFSGDHLLRFWSKTTMSDTDTCFVCDDEIPYEYSKWDPKAPVYADDYVYHKGCEDEIFEWYIENDSM